MNFDINNKKYERFPDAETKGCDSCMMNMFLQLKTTFHMRFQAPRDELSMMSVVKAQTVMCT